MNPDRPRPQPSPTADVVWPPTLTFVGTATTVLHLGPFRLLTDPNFLHRGQRAYLGHGLWSRRLTEPALSLDQLPPLDAVLLSHLHGDHFDRVARRGLDHALPVLTTVHASRRLTRWGFDRAHGLLPWDRHVLERAGWRLRVVATPGRHAPERLEFLTPPVMGSVLELTDLSPDARRRTFRTYVTGDTLFRPWLSEVAERLGPFDAMVAHLGGTRLLGVVLTMDGEQGADLVRLLRPRLVVPVHHDDYRVFRSPLGDFHAALAARGLGRGTPVEVVDVGRGETVDLAPA